MKKGAWIEAETGNWHWIDDHADWIRRPECGRRAGLPEEVVLRLAAMPRRYRSGAERNAILIAAMSEGGLVRFRGHGAWVTFETTLPLEVVIPAVTRFMATICGPLTWVRFNQLPDGPYVGVTYQDLGRALEAGDLFCLAASERPRSRPSPSWTEATRATAFPWNKVASSSAAPGSSLHPEAPPSPPVSSGT